MSMLWLFHCHDDGITHALVGVCGDDMTLRAASPALYAESSQKDACNVIWFEAVRHAIKRGGLPERNVGEDLRDYSRRTGIRIMHHKTSPALLWAIVAAAEGTKNSS